MAIRSATLEDIPRLVSMGKVFTDLAGFDGHVGYNEVDVAVTLERMIALEDYCLLVGDNSMLGGCRSPHPFNHSHWIAEEMFWWSEGREGLRLLKAFENWAAEKCQTVKMITIDAINFERMSVLYSKLGYAPIERTFIKVL